MTKFVNEFPNAVDVIIRGIKSGLPLGDCLRVIAAESGEPIKSEFRRVVEAQTLGLSVTEAVERLVDRVPVAESNFFAIVIGIQQKAGGNLSEALGNLSRVIRERKKMKAKVKAVSSEAKTSAAIIGALPFLVGFFVYLTTPQYMEALWTTTTGRIVCAGCAIWMLIGCLIMKKMINFEL
jgi:tight adherence protein B